MGLSVCSVLEYHSIQTKQTARCRTVCLFLLVCYLFRDCSARANICASTALGADFGVNRIVFAFRDSAHRAFILASTACDAVGRNYVSHSSIILFISILVVFNSAFAVLSSFHFSVPFVAPSQFSLRGSRFCCNGSSFSLNVRSFCFNEPSFHLNAPLLLKLTSPLCRIAVQRYDKKLKYQKMGMFFLSKLLFLLFALIFCERSALPSVSRWAWLCGHL